jgi:plastocyanin
MFGTRLLAPAVLLTVGLIACGSNSSSPTAPPNGGIAGVSLGTPDVVISATAENIFDPAMERVTVGEIIEWKNTGAVEHNIVFSTDTSSDPWLGVDSEPALRDQVLLPGGGWQVKFTTPGIYSYLCTIHAGMVGTIVVTSG